MWTYYDNSQVLMPAIYFSSAYASYICILHDHDNYTDILACALGLFK